LNPCHTDFQPDAIIAKKFKVLKLEMGSGQNLVGGNFLVLRPGQVSHFWFVFGFGKLPLKIPNFLIFSLRIQKKSYWVGSKSTWVKDGLVSLLAAGQKYVRVGSGQGPSLIKTAYYKKHYKSVMQNERKLFR